MGDYNRRRTCQSFLTSCVASLILLFFFSINYSYAEPGGAVGRRFTLKHHLLSRKRNNQQGITATATITSTTAANNKNHNTIGIASYRTEYDNDVIQEKLIPHKADEFQFQRFQSPSSIQNALQWKKDNKNEKKNHHSNNFTFFQGKDGRKGYVSSTKLGGDWVLAQSKQIAKETTAKEVLRAYLNGSLQEHWNQKEVLRCQFTCRDIQDDYLESTNSENDGDDDDDDGIISFFSNTKSLQRKSFSTKRSRRTNKDNNMINTGKFYEQDLVLRSQRVITSETGIMKYTQTITIDQVGDDKYCVLVRLDDDTTNDGNDHHDHHHHQQQQQRSTKCKPFDSLLVHVGLEQNGNDVNIYADGIMKVNRKVVPNLIVFDASGIAGSMAGKGTLWLGAHFEQESIK